MTPEESPLGWKRRGLPQERHPPATYWRPQTARCGEHSHRIHGAGIYANIGGILMGSMLPYIAYMDPSWDWEFDSQWGVQPPKKCQRTNRSNKCLVVTKRQDMAAWRKCELRDSLHKTWTVDVTPSQWNVQIPWVFICFHVANMFKWPCFTRFRCSISEAWHKQQTLYYIILHYIIYHIILYYTIVYYIILYCLILSTPL